MTDNNKAAFANAIREWRKQQDIVSEASLELSRARRKLKALSEQLETLAKSVAQHSGVQEGEHLVKVDGQVYRLSNCRGFSDFERFRIERIEIEDVSRE